MIYEQEVELNINNCIFCYGSYTVMMEFRVIVRRGLRFCGSICVSWIWRVRKFIDKLTYYDLILKYCPRGQLLANKWNVNDFVINSYILQLFSYVILNYQYAHEVQYFLAGLLLILLHAKPDKELLHRFYCY